MRRVAKLYNSVHRIFEVQLSQKQLRRGKNILNNCRPNWISNLNRLFFAVLQMDQESYLLSGFQNRYADADTSFTTGIESLCSKTRFR